MRNRAHTIPAFLCVAIILAPFICVNALAERLPVRTYTSADGLGSSFIDYLMRDSRGFMWFCTRDGLSRFDGSRFTTYQIGDESSPGVETIYEARNGVYWVGTTGGLYRFNPNALTSPRTAKNGRPILDAEYLGGWRGNLFEDSKGNMWFTSGGLFQVVETNGKVSISKVDLNLPSETNREYGVNALFEAADGCLWINTTFGLVRRLPDLRIVFYPYRQALIEGTTAVLLDSRNRVWLKRGVDLFVINPAPLESINDPARVSTRELNANAIQQLKPEVEIRLPATSGEVLQLVGRPNVDQRTIKNLYETSDGHVWLTSDKDLFEYDGRVFHRFSVSQGLAVAMGRMAEDGAGNLWIAGQTDLVRLDRRGFLSYGEPDGLRSARLSSITEDPNGTLYVSNGDFYLSKFDQGVFRTVAPRVSPTAKSIWTSRSAFLDSAGEWWLMTNEGLYRYAAGGGFVSLNNRRPVAVYGKHNGLKSDSVFQVFEDKHGDLWISTRGIASEAGLSRWHRADQTIHTFSAEENFPPRRAVSSFAEDRDGNLWFGFYDDGVARYRNGRFTVFAGRDGLPRGLISDLLIDRQGRLWVASARGGLYRLDDTNAESPRFVSYTTNEGLNSNNIRTIAEDSFGNIYAGSVRGVDRLTPDNGRVRHFSVSDGLAADFVVDSLCDKNGTLWFATMNGLSRLVPSGGDDAPNPPIWLGGLSISGLPQPVSQLGTARIESLELTHSQNNIQVDFFSLYFHPGETLHYQYKLEGAAADWSPPSEVRSVTFANLSPARYRFLVRAVNAEGVASSEPAVVTFTILPPIWFRWWFIGLASILVGAAAYAIDRQRAARRRERRRAREALRQAREERLRELEQMRGRIAADLHDDIGSNLTRISLISEVAQRRLDGADPPVREQLSSIGKLSRELVDSMSEIVWAINPNKDHMGDLTQKMRHFASDLLTARHIDFSFRAVDLDQDMKVGANVRREVFLIFKEAINNVARHSGCTEVDIELRADDDSLLLRIADNGKGFDSTAASLGHGLVSMRERARSLGGGAEIDSTPGLGTTLRFSVPHHPLAELNDAT